MAIRIHLRWQFVISLALGQRESEQYCSPQYALMLTSYSYVVWLVACGRTNNPKEKIEIRIRYVHISSMNVSYKRFTQGQHMHAPALAGFYRIARDALVATILPLLPGMIFSIASKPVAGHRRRMTTQRLTPAAELSFQRNAPSRARPLNNAYRKS
jgi:hypothetical protein